MINWDKPIRAAENWASSPVMRPPARVICKDREGIYPYICLIKYNGGEHTNYCDENGFYYGKQVIENVPEKKKYRVALMDHGPLTVIADTTAVAVEKWPTFKRWLTDWVEYEVSP